MNPAETQKAITATTIVVNGSKGKPTIDINTNNAIYTAIEIAHIPQFPDN